jgi:hypothetical protein
MSKLISAKKIMKELREQYPNNNSYTTNIVKIINQLKPNEASNKTVAKALIVYRAELVRIKKIETAKLENQSATPRETMNYMSIREMKEIWEGMDDGVDKLMLGFYLFYPPLRSDWSNVEIEGNYFVFDKFIKRKEGNNQGDLRKLIVPELKYNLRFLERIPRVNASFASRLVRITTKVYGKQIGINMFRKIYIFENRNMSLAERKEIAKDMNHSVGISRLYYEKVDLN